MSEIITIAIDAMGGDHAPDEVVAGAALLSLEAPHIQTLLVGDSARIGELLDKTSHNGERIAVHHAPEFIGMDEKPREALEAKPNASVLLAAQLVRSGEAQAMVTAGNTGAAVLACAKTFSLIPGVRRGALAAVFPTQKLRGEKQDPFSLILDVGATVEASAQDLVAFAIMGAAYARAVSRNENPEVGLLSNGTEEMKGPKSVVEAHQLLKAHSGVNFIGNVEGVDIPKGTADVIVCDGFTGNIVLKVLEGVSETVVSLAHYAYKEKLMWRAGLAMLSGGINRLKELTDWEQYGGAPILGFDHLCLKAHGRSKARAIANATKVAAKTVSSGLTKNIADAVAQTQARVESKAS